MNDRLYRSRDDRMLAGVAGGLADYWGADPSLIRVIWAVLMLFTGGLALVIYIVMAIVVPEEPFGAYTTPPVPPAPTVDPTAAAPGVAAAPAAPAAPATGTGWTPPWTPVAGQPAGYYPTDRWAARQARREARRAYRRDHGSGLGVVFVGLFLVLLGAFFLAREWLPQLDFDWFWPLVLIALGVLVLAAALGWTRDDRGTAR